MTTEIDWDNAPEGAEFYAFNEFRKKTKGRRPRFFSYKQVWEIGIFTMAECRAAEDYQERPQPKPKYIYGVEYPTNGQKPDLPDDVLLEQYYLGGWNGPLRYDQWSWGEVTKFRIVDERYKPVETAQDELKQPDPVNLQSTTQSLQESKQLILSRHR